MTAPRTIYVRESRRVRRPLSPEEAASLIATGRLLAGRPELSIDPREEEDDRQPTKIAVEPAEPGVYWIRVNEAVGVVATELVQLIVLPKIPLQHLLYLLAQTDQFPAPPEPDEHAAGLKGGGDLWNFLAAWFVSCVERVLMLDLIRDYNEATADLRSARGRILPMPTAYHYYAGRLELRCEYEEFDFNTPLNRLLKGAVMLVASAPTIHADLRGRALGVLARMEEVGAFSPTDLEATLDRRTAHYRDAALLAKHLITHVGRTFQRGEEVAWTFLFRTPERVEEGVLRLLQRALGSKRVFKESLALPGSDHLEVRPDLVFRHPDAIGDVKYKLSEGKWYRPDLYQVVAHAAAFEVHRAALVRFRKASEPALPELRVGKHLVREFTWLAEGSEDPERCAQELVAAVRSWHESLPATLRAI